MEYVLTFYNSYGQRQLKQKEEHSRFAVVSFRLMALCNFALESGTERAPHIPEVKPSKSRKLRRGFVLHFSSTDFIFERLRFRWGHDENVQRMRCNYRSVQMSREV